MKLCSKCQVEKDEATDFHKDSRTGKVEWQTLWDRQQGLCALCGIAMLREGREKLSAVVDHDHKCCSGSKSCGKCVRGLVHWRCNIILGYADDDVALLRQAAAYLDSLG